MTISDVPLLSAVPKRSLGEANFSTVADTWAASLVTFNTGMNVTIGEINSTAAAMNSIAAGTAQSMPFTFSTTTTDSDPGAGIIRLNNATQASSTAMRLDDLDSAGQDIQAIIDTWADSTSTIAGQIRIINAADQTKWLQFTITAVTSAAGYTNLTVVNVDSSGVDPFSASDALLVSFTRTGDKGDTGATGGAVVFISAALASNDATINFVLTGGYDEYELHILNAIPATDDVDAWLRTSTDGGSNYDEGASDYAHVVSNGASITNISADTKILMNRTASVGVGSDANENGVSNIVRIINPAAAVYTSILGAGAFINSDAVAQVSTLLGQRLSAADVDAIRFMFSSGNVESGLFALYGVSRA